MVSRQISIWRQTSTEASARKTALPLSSRQGTCTERCHCRDCNSRSKVCVKYAGPMERWNDAPVTTCEGQSRRGLSHLRLSANTAMLRTACFLCVIGHRELLAAAELCGGGYRLARGSHRGGVRGGESAAAPLNPLAARAPAGLGCGRRSAGQQTAGGAQDHRPCSTAFACTREETSWGKSLNSRKTRITS